MNSDAIRAKAIQSIDPEFYEEKTDLTVLKHYIMEIPLDRVGLPFCPSCESRLCGLCGACHELDWEPDEQNPLNFGPFCPLSVIDLTDTCSSWRDGYLFLKYAEEEMREE